MKIFTFFILLLILSFSRSDGDEKLVQLEWDENAMLKSSSEQLYKLSFKGCEYLENSGSLPFYVEKIPLKNGVQPYVSLTQEYYEKINPSSELLALMTENEGEKLQTFITQSGQNRFLNIQLFPFKEENEDYFRLKSFGLKTVYGPSENVEKSKTSFSAESVLKSGKWLKIKTTQKGIHKIKYSTLSSWGFNSPGNVNVFGNNGYMLSEEVGNSGHDDLKQFSVWKGKDGSGEDCLFFYSTGNIKWNLDASSGLFKRTRNIYSNETYYFLTEDVGSTKTVPLLQIETAEKNHVATSYDYFELHELESENLIKSGKTWFGEKFINNTSHNFSFNLSNKETNSPVKVYAEGAGRSSSNSQIDFSIGGEILNNLFYYAVNTNSQTAPHVDMDDVVFEYDTNNETMTLNLKYGALSGNAMAWLDFIVLNYRKNLKFVSNELVFRDTKTAATGNIVEYTIQNASTDLKVLDITDVSGALEIPTETSGSSIVFTRSADSVHEYAVFNPAGNFPEPEQISEISNQNLHAIETPTMVIVSHPNFIDYANELALFHQQEDGFTVSVVKSNEVYNEFGSGMPDASSIRNFIKLLYDKGSGLKYVLLFGDGNFDNRNILGHGHTFIPTYQSENSILPTASFVTDDYFVLLDEGETVYQGEVDLGIGRLPVSTLYEAEIVLNKIKNYKNNDALGGWRNVTCFIADDEDTNLHMNQTEELTNQVNSNYPQFLTDKIYFDAFQQIATPSGEQYPDVTKAINDRVKDGVLILNYVGHANERFLSDEHVLDVSHINSWSNSTKLPIFVTATCEFSRFDDVETSAGEYVLFNPNGGGIGLFSTTRLVFAQSNHRLSKNFYNHVFEKDENGQHYRMGDIMRLAKVATIGTINKRNFTLLADPALKLSYPKYKVVTTQVNQTDAEGQADTISALNKVTISGYVAGYNGEKLTSFNGQIAPVVYDKAVMRQTLGNAGEYPMEFKVQENVIYKGLSSVSNGEFTFSFIVPKDISYSLGQGKVVYYAQNGTDDAHGAFENFYIGGSSESQISDTNGPEIELYLDDTDFISGDETSKNPTMLAFLSDENGINTVGTGIGHDITAVIDNDYSNTIILNDYYLANIDDYKSGQIEFPLQGLAPGHHTLKLKAWDIANNSSEQEIEFIVTEKVNIEEVSNYPNPVNDYTFFTFTHNQPDASFQSRIEIYDVAGQMIDVIETTINSNGQTSNPVRWDIQELNSPLRSGIYLYRIMIKSTDGDIVAKTGKMVFAR